MGAQRHALAAGLETYVVTRNSHEADIKSYLAARGVLTCAVLEGIQDSVDGVSGRFRWCEWCYKAF